MGSRRLPSGESGRAGATPLQLPLMRRLADNLWIIRYPQSLLGMQVGRTVTVIRLNSGELVIHSTGPFSPSDVAAIRERNRPAMIVEATLFHHTFSKHGLAAFPGIPCAAPEGFAGATAPMSILAEKWPGELAVLELAGMPKLREHVLLHRPTRTLIVADLVFNFGPSATAWTRFFFRRVSGIREYPGVSRLFRSLIRDRAAFIRGIDQLLAWDFDRVVVAHGDIIETGGRAQLQRALAKHGLCSSRT